MLTELYKECDIPFIKGNIKSNNLLFFEEYLKLNKRESEVDLFISESNLKNKQYDLRNSHSYVEIIGSFELINDKERIGIFLETPGFKIEIEYSLYEKYKKEFNLNIIRGKFKVIYSSSSDTYSLLNLEIFNFNSNINNWGKLREKFDCLNWENIIFNSLGMNGNVLYYQERLLLLSRLFPLLEKNFNYLEYGPKSVGKTTIFSLFSDHCTIKDSNATEAKILYDNKENKKGEIFNSNVLVLDEATSLKENLGIGLQTYMSERIVKKAKIKEELSTSIVLVGNFFKYDFLDLYSPYTESLLDILKLGKDTAAIFDRAHFFNPSWGIRRIVIDKDYKENIEYIPISYISEIISSLRNIKFNSKEFLKINGFPYEFGDSRVNEAIYKNLSAIMKLLYPNIVISDSMLIQPQLKPKIYPILTFAIEGRAAISNLLNKHNKEFPSLSPLQFQMMGSSHTVLNQNIKTPEDAIGANLILKEIEFLNDITDINKGVPFYSSQLKNFISYNSTIYNYYNQFIMNFNNISNNNYCIFRNLNLNYLFGYNRYNVDMAIVNFDINYYNIKYIKEFKCECEETTLNRVNFEIGKCGKCGKEFYLKDLK